MISAIKSLKDELKSFLLFTYCKYLAYKYYYLCTNKNLYIGNGSQVRNSKFSKNVTIYNNALVLNSSIGDFSYINSYCNINKSEIGKFCSIGKNVTIGVGRHPISEFISTHPAFYSNSKYPQNSFVDKNYFDDDIKKTNIGSDVWIGDNTYIKDGVRIGHGAIIGFGSFLNKDVEPYAIYAGVPAKRIRYRFTEEEITILLEKQWWNSPCDLLMEKVELLRKPDIFFKFF